MTEFIESFNEDKWWEEWRELTDNLLQSALDVKTIRDYNKLMGLVELECDESDAITRLEASAFDLVDHITSYSDDKTQEK